jgi:hypothetical protein
LISDRYAERVYLYARQGEVQVSHLKTVAFVLAFGITLSCQSFAAEQFPLTAHIKRIEQDKKIHLEEGTGGTQTWHLVTAEIDSHTYGLEVRRRSFHALDWLHVQDYPCRRTKHGFEVQYQDGGKIHTREFVIVSEE